MDERIIRFRVGVVVLAAILAGGILVFAFGNRSRFLGQYTLYIQFDTAPGVTVNTPVRKNGITIGRVSNVELLDDGVMLTARIDSDKKIRQSELCQISSATLLGDAVLEFVPGDDRSLYTSFYSNGDTMQTPGIVQINPMQALSRFAEVGDDLDFTVQAVGRAGEQVGNLAQDLTNVINNNQDQFKRIMDKTEASLASLEATSNTINQLVSDPELSAALRDSIKKAPVLLDELQNSLAQAKETLDGFKSMSARAENNLANLEKFTKPLGERGEQIVVNVEQSLSGLNELVREIVAFSRQLNESEGTLGQLVRDRELYDKVKSTVTEIERVAKQVGPLMADIRVLAKKLKDDPRQLGVKGALDRRPSGVSGARTPSTGFGLGGYESGEVIFGEE
jgi:phospholipid/cholesterol/gamma-HCH transport system substrate-binding protein